MASIYFAYELLHKLAMNIIRCHLFSEVNASLGQPISYPFNSSIFSTFIETGLDDQQHFMVIVIYKIYFANAISINKKTRLMQLYNSKRNTYSTYIT